MTGEPIMTEAARAALDAHLSQYSRQILETASAEASKYGSEDEGITLRDVQAAINESRLVSVEKVQVGARRSRVGLLLDAYLLLGGFLLLFGLLYLTWPFLENAVGYVSTVALGLTLGGFGLIVSSIVLRFYYRVLLRRRREEGPSTRRGDIQEGDFLAAFATLEERLRTAAGIDLDERQTQPLTSILNTLERRGALSPRGVSELRTIIDARNRVAHGASLGAVDLESLTQRTQVIADEISSLNSR